VRDLYGGETMRGSSVTRGRSTVGGQWASGPIDGGADWGHHRHR